MQEISELQTRAPSIRLWAFIALVSPTSEIAFQMLLGRVPGWLIWLRILLLIAVAAAGARSKPLAVLRPFALADLLQTGCIAVRDLELKTPLYRLAAARGFGWSELFLALSMFAIIGPVWIWCARRSDRFFIHVGHLSAPVRPFRVRWSVIAPAFAIVAALCAWGFVGLTGAHLPLLWSVAPVAVMLAAINAFQEEFIYRNVMAGAVLTDFGPVQAVGVSAFVFGIGHWNGLPAGALGVLMTLALGLVAGTAMVQTKGIFWPWFMHFLPDCVLLYYWGIGSVSHSTIGTGHL